MSAPRIQLHPSTPWSLRVFDRLPFAPLWVGAGIGLAVFALYLVYTGLFSEDVGRLAGVRGSHWLAELIQDFFVGFTLAISAASVRGARRDLADLRPHLEASPAAADELERAALTYQRFPLLLLGLAVGAGAAFGTVTDASLWSDGRRLGWTDPSVLWMFGRNFLNWWIVSRAMGLELMLARAFSKLGDRLKPFDLLDRRPLAPFARRALRNALLWMLLTAFLSLTYLGEGWASDMMVVALAWLGAFALTVFVLPLLGAHRRVGELKQAELDRLRAAIGEARAQVLGRSAAEQPGGGRLSDLVSYELRVDAVSEWPIDASTLLRLGFYLFFGLGSWVGAAVVERLLDTALR